MEQINSINLVQSGTVTVAILGCFLLWRVHEFKGVSLLLCLIALASLINILEETGMTRDWHLISPIFIMLFGPATYLAAKFAVNRGLNKKDYLHLLPALPLVFFTSHVHIVIAIGTAWRLIYTYLTASMLVGHKKLMDEQRSDSDEYSLNWLACLLVIMLMFNLVDLVRLNFQATLTYELNIIGQGINNLAWLIATMTLIYQFSHLSGLPNTNSPLVENNQGMHVKGKEYESIFKELDTLIIKNKWYLMPRLTLANISEYTGMQTRDVSRAINLHTNMSFNQYINQFRVNAVCKKLKTDSRLSITEVAFDSGFSSKASFNKVFKQMVGKTPSEYKSSI